MSQLILHDIQFKYGKSSPLFSSFNLTINSGEVTGLLGPNGAGKTTLFHLVAGLLKPKSGTINFQEDSQTHAGAQLRSQLGFLPDDLAANPNLTAQENMNVYAILWRIPAKQTREKTEHLFKQLGLWDVRNQQVHSFSKGMKQKLAICLAVIADPPILLLDEPFSGLDLESAIWARDFFKQISRQGKCVIFSSHIPELIEQLSDRIVILNKGDVHWDGLQQDRTTSLLEMFRELSRGTPNG